eukprot:COSAG01_NODE_13636_length_1555_cov_1.560440_1_plen_183_part_10
MEVVGPAVGGMQRASSGRNQLLILLPVRVLAQALLESLLGRRGGFQRVLEILAPSRIVAPARRTQLLQLRRQLGLLLALGLQLCGACSSTRSQQNHPWHAVMRGVIVRHDAARDPAPMPHLCIKLGHLPRALVLLVGRQIPENCQTTSGAGCTSAAGSTSSATGSSSSSSSSSRQPSGSKTTH